MQMQDVRAVVTGGARGMGYAFVENLKREGAQVFFCDLEGVEEASRALDAPGTNADVSSEEDVCRLFDEAADAMGSVNCLINNAGIIRDGLLVNKRGEGLSKAKWDAVLAVNLTGPFLCMREFAVRAVRDGIRPAVAVNMSSISRAGNMGQSNYAAAKAGLVADTVLWGKELARHGIRVGAIAPGFIRTPMVESMPADVLEKVLKPVPLRRLGEPAEVYSAIRFVVDCEYFTGRVVEVDGGLRL